MPEKLTQIAAAQRPPFVSRRGLLRTPQAASSRARNEAVCGCRLSPETRGSPILRPPDPGIRCGSAARVPSAFPSPCRKDAHNISKVTCFKRKDHYYHRLLDSVIHKG